MSTIPAMSTIDKLLDFMGLGPSLADIHEPTPLCIRARVAAENGKVLHPMFPDQTGVSAPLYDLTFTIKSSSPTDPKRFLFDSGTVIAHQIFSGELLLDARGGQILVPAGRFSIEYREFSSSGCGPLTELPPGLDHVLTLAREHLAATQQEGSLWCDWRSLHLGDFVELAATIAPGAGPGAPFLVQPDGGEVKLTYLHGPERS